jgi:hypothetical protein
MRRVVFASVLVVMSIVCWTEADEKTAARKVFEPVMPLSSLMAEQDRHFEVIVGLLRNANDPERAEKLRHASLALSEMSNINGFHKGATEHDDYRAWAGQLKDQAKQMA